MNIRIKIIIQEVIILISKGKIKHMTEIINIKTIKEIIIKITKMIQMKKEEIHQNMIIENTVPIMSIIMSMKKIHIKAKWI